MVVKHKFQGRDCVRFVNREPGFAPPPITNGQGARVFIEGYGCSASAADTEMISGLIDRGGYELVAEPEDADIRVIVTCAVKKVTEERMLARIGELASYGKVIVAGCLAEAEPKQIEKIEPNIGFLGPNRIDRILPVLESALRGQRRIEVGSAKLVKLGMPRTRKNRVVGIVEISSGCLSACTFCQVKLVKGRVFSYPENTIDDEARTLVDQGAREIWLTSTDNAAYGRDSDSTLPALIRSVCDIPGEFIVRVGMMNPLLTGRILEEMIEVFGNQKVFKFLHLPVQSGNDRILKIMQRGYSVDDFLQIVRAFRNAVPDLTLSTDMIVGFPQETYAEFEDSLELLRNVRPDIVNISRFGPRPGTKAAEMDSQISNEESKKRSTIMTELVRRISNQRNKTWIGWKGKVLVDEKVKNAVIGRNFSYKPCLIRLDESASDEVLGHDLVVQITDATASTLRARVSEA